MATDDISVSIGVQGESKFKKVLTECQNTVKQLDSALKANAAEYEANADALAENVEKGQLLRKSIEAQKKLIDEMGDAIKYSTEKYGAASRQTTQYVVAQNKAKEAVAKLEKELKDTDREMEELGRDSRTVGQQLESGIGDSAEETARSLEEMYNQLKGDLGDIKNFAGFSVMGDVAGGILDAAQNLYDFTESTRDYRRQISFLEQNAVDAGLEWALVKGQLDEINTVTGDLDASVEGISNLLATGFDSSELQLAVDALAGAVIKFPDTLKFESLADGLQETIATGEAVGAFAELLERNGIALDDFNKAMAQATTEEEKQQVALSFLANHGLEETYQGWQKNNEELIKAEEAQQKLTNKMAGLSKEVEPLSTAMTNMATATVGTITTLLQDSQIDEWITGKINGITEIIGLIATADGRAELLERATEGMGEVYGVEGDLDQQIEAQKRAINELKMWGDAVTLAAAEQKLAQLEAAKEAGAEAGSSVAESTAAGVEAESETLKTTGANAVIEINNGMVEEEATLTSTMSTMGANASNAFNSSFDISPAVDSLSTFNTLINSGAGSVSGSPGGGGNVKTRETARVINMYMDKTKVATALVDDINAAQGRTVAMA